MLRASNTQAVSGWTWRRCGRCTWLWPVPLRPNQTAAQFAWQYRVVEEGKVYVLQAARPERWLDLYSFTLEEQPAPELRLMLLNRKLTERTADGLRETMLVDDGALLETLEERFGLRFEKGTHFSFEEAPAA